MSAEQTWSLLLPNNWWQIPLGDVQIRDAAIKKFTEEQLGRSDELAAARHEVNALLKSQYTDVEPYAQLGAMIVGPISGTTMPGSLVVSLYPVGSFRQDLLQPLLDTGKTEQLTEIPTDDGVLRRRHYCTVLAKRKTRADEDLRVTHLDYFFPIPGGAETLQLAFSTPVQDERLVSKMLEYFDLISSSLVFDQPNLGEPE